jgi:hypothetical protein
VLNFQAIEQIDYTRPVGAIKWVRLKNTFAFLKGFGQCYTPSVGKIKHAIVLVSFYFYDILGFYLGSL